MKVIKQSRLNGTLVIQEISKETAKNMMVKNHYSKKWNSAFGIINIGIFKDDRLLGAAVFGNLMNSKSYKNITDLGEGSVIELNRMWIDDELGKNAETILISSSFKIIKKKYPHIKFVQSFADGRLGCGTIYKASNFKYFGYSKSLFFEDIESGEVFHKVPLECTNRPVGFINKNRRYLDRKLKPFYVKTYRYIYQLDKKHKIKLNEQVYPKYEKGIEPVDYTHSLGLLVRLMIMYDAIGDKLYCDKVRLHIRELGFNKTDVNNELKKQHDNKSVQWFLDEYIANERNIDKLIA